MADWTMGSTDEPGAAIRLAPPFDATGFDTVLTGERDGYRWELRDGPHPCPGTDDAVGRELRTRGPRGGGSAGAVGPRLPAGVDLEVSGSSSGRAGAEIAMLTVRCRPGVATVRTRFVDGTVVDDQPVVSVATGEAWAVVALIGRADVETVTALDAAGATLSVDTPDDPRDRRPRPTWG